MRPVQPRTILWGLAVLSLLKFSECLTSRHTDQAQDSFLVSGEEGGGRGGREASDDPQTQLNLTSVSVFHLNNSHLHLMVHWPGKGSNVVFCLTRDPVRLLKLL